MRYFLVTLLFFFSVELYADISTIAVIDFHGDTISPGESAEVTRLVIDGLRKSGGFAVIKGGDTCRDMSCAASAGKALGAVKVILGSIRKNGTGGVLSCRIIDTATGSPDTDLTERCGENCTDAARKLAVKISAAVERSLKSAPIVITPTITSINSDDRKFSANSLSPYVAGVLSLMPVWSGSWNSGFNGWGLFFVMGKLSSLTAMAMYGTVDDKIKSDYRKEISAREIYLQSEYGTIDPNDSVLIELNKKLDKAPEDNGLEPAFYYSLGALCAFLVIDIVYSIYTVNEYNRSLSSAYYNEVDIDLEPRIAGMAGLGKDYGVDIAVPVHFCRSYFICLPGR